MNPGHAFLILTFALLTSLSARETRVDEIDSPTEAKSGKIALLKSAKGMSYFLRLPRGYKEDDGARLIMFLHGSNMNGLQYLETFEAQRWCKTDILVCPNGETGNNPRGANNFTFNSAPFVAEITADIQKSFNITHSYLGGHS
ncbi:MAG: hypothetical protein ACSHYF_15345 [Verrucomicrobiaceae bacterium]